MVEATSFPHHDRHPSKDDAADAIGNASSDGSSAEKATPEDNDSGKNTSLENKPASKKELEKRTEQLTIQLEEILNERRMRYADRLAKDHGRFFGRFLKSNTRLSGILKKIPLLQKVSTTVNNKIDSIRSEDSADDLRADYEDAVKVYIKHASRESVKNDDPEKTSNTPENVQAKQLILLTSEDALLEDAICKCRQGYSKKATRFSSWWLRQKGIVGAVKTGAVIVGAGLVTGVTIATGGLLLGVGTAVIAPAAGGLVGFGAAKHVTNRQANSFVDKERTRTIAEQESEEAQEKNSNILQQKAGEGGLLIDDAVDIITGAVEERASEAIKKNRNRYKTMVALGTLGARMGGILADGIGDWFAGSSQKNHLANIHGKSNVDTSGDGSGGSAPDGADPTVPHPETPDTTVIQGNEFTVEPGNGLTHELQGFARLNGRDLTPEQVWDLHKELIDKFGSYIDGPGTYQMGPTPYDIGISSPGSASWKKGTAEYIMDWMSRH